jgi:hypothetical protein
MVVWPIVISDSFRDIMVKRGTSQLQNSDSNFLEEETGRTLDKYWFEKTQNGEKVRRA